MSLKIVAIESGGVVLSACEEGRTNFPTPTESSLSSARQLMAVLLSQ